MAVSKCQPGGSALEILPATHCSDILSGVFFLIYFRRDEVLASELFTDAGTYLCKVSRDKKLIT